MTRHLLSNHRKWGQFRYAVVGSLMSSPPAEGELSIAIQALANKTWKHPISGVDVQFAFSTIESWFYRMRQDKIDPVTCLNRQGRKDQGKNRAISRSVALKIAEQYAQYPWWTMQLHGKNLRAALKRQHPDGQGGQIPSYATLVRYMRSRGLKRKPMPTINEKGELEGLTPSQTQEKACFEAEFVNQLWSLDFHHGHLRVLAPNGQWLQPIAAAILDHHSRLICHLAWGFFETTEELINCYKTAVMKRGRPLQTLSDNGSAMRSGEFIQGLKRLGIKPKKIRPKAAYQNGKTENFWNSLEKNLCAMVLGQENLTLATLNSLSQAWVEMEYNRTIHKETGQKPLDLFIKSKNIGLPSVDEDTLRRAFRIEDTRTPRASDGSIRIEGTLFRLPQSFWHFSQVLIRYARWDLSYVHLVDPVSGKELDRIYPVDKLANSSCQRRVLADPVLISKEKTRSQCPPSLQDCKDAYENLTHLAFGIPSGENHAD